MSEPFLRQYAETRRFANGRPASARLAPGGDAVLFLRSPPRSPVQSLWETDLGTGRTRLLADPEAALAGAAARLSAAERARLERQRITARGFTHFELARDGRTVLLGLGGRLLALDRASGAGTVLPAGEGALAPRLSPDGGRVAYVRDGDLHVLGLRARRERRLTRARAPWVSHGLAEFVAQEEMHRAEGFWWSPDGRRVAVQETDEREVDQLVLADPMHPDREPHRLAYPRAGRANARVRLGVVPAAGGRIAWIRWDARRWPYLAAARWDAGGPLVLLVQDRAQRSERLLAADPRSGATRLLLEERDDAWLNLVPGMPRWLEDGRGFLWVTERRGAPELELRGPRGEPRAGLVGPALGFVALCGADARGTIYFTCCGDDPTGERLFRVREGEEPEPIPLPDDEPSHVSASVADDGSALLVTRATASRLPRTEALRPDGTLVAELPSVAERPPFLPRVELRKVGQGEGLWTALVRPRGAAAGARLPVVVSVYGGPLPAAYTPMGASHAPRLLDQWLADRGFLVFSADGRGTPRRGRAFERAIRGDLTLPLDDQVTALRALAREVPEMDLGRVGIVGWSFGGYLAALAAMRRPDVFRAAVAGAPVVDFAAYDTHYTERYLGLPDEHPEAYARSSLLTHAAGLERPLLVIHGTADDNVWFQHALALSDALFRAGRHHELLPLSGLTHQVPDPVVMERMWERIAAFFREHLR